MRPLPIANPQGRFERTLREYDVEENPGAPLQVFEDASRKILSDNDSPDIGFRWSVNPYRGCFHGCAYCYARPTHEYLSFGAGTDFDRKIVVKPEAPALLREAFEKKSWKGELVAFSGVTDCYQPLEATLRLTRGCLEVCAEYKNPVSIITKSPVIERDVDLLRELAREASCHVTVSVPFWNAENARALEPWVTTPARRMKIVETLAKAGIPVGVGVSPIVPGLSDQDMVRVLEAAAGAGATYAFYVLLRLPGAVRPVFEERLRERLPLRAEKVLRRLREAYGGEVYDARFGMRGRGEGPYAQAIGALFEATTKRLGIATGEWSHEVPHTFRRPPRAGEQTGFGF
jgi:DNA repair photolyase